MGNGNHGISQTKIISIFGCAHFQVQGKVQVMGNTTTASRKLPCENRVLNVTVILQFCCVDFWNTMWSNCFSNVACFLIFGRRLLATRAQLKKVDLGSSFSNLRLISNSSYISKLTEKAVFQQLNNHLSTNKLYPKLQSAYRKYHSTEKALLKVRNGILLIWKINGFHYWLYQTWVPHSTRLTISYC